MVMMCLTSFSATRKYGKSACAIRRKMVLRCVTYVSRQSVTHVSRLNTLRVRPQGLLLEELLYQQLMQLPRRVRIQLDDGGGARAVAGRFDADGRQHALEVERH